MRNKTPIPIGQGCRRAKGLRFSDAVTKKGKCQCHPDLYINICINCGDFFHTEMAHARTCSGRCRTALWRTRNFDTMFQTVMSFAEGAT